MIEDGKLLHAGQRKVNAPATKNKLKRGAVVAGMIEKDILAAGWCVGTVFATETQLIERYAIGRGVLREAIGQLERRGIATTRRGHNGGLVISAPARTATILALASYLELTDSDLRQMLEVRLLLDSLAVNLACERLRESSIRILRTHSEKLNLQTNSLGDVALASYAIREVIRESSGNPLLSMLIEAIEYSSRDLLAFQISDLQSIRELMAENATNKRKLVSAIINCDKLDAQQVLVQDTSALISSLDKHLTGTETQLSANLRPDAFLQPLKLGHSIALRISHDIGRRGLPEGYRLGREPELIAQFDVSRAAFREAVRMLEAHSIVHMGRGRNGGLTVGKPDPSNTIDSFLLYTTYLGLSLEAMWEVHEALYLGVVKFAAHRAKADDRDRLQAALQAVKNAATREAKIRKLIGLHRAIYDACHNKVLSLLARAVLMAHVRMSDPETMNQVELDLLTQSYEHIVTAICEANEGLAVRSMFHHIQINKQRRSSAPPTDAACGNGRS